MKRRNLIILMISLSLVLLLGSSYALLRSTQVGTTPYVINVGTLQVTFEEGKTEKLSLENMYPMSDKEGSSLPNELGFTVKNTGTVASYYDITLEETSRNPEFKSVIRFISNKDNKGYNEPKTLSEDKYVEVGGYLEPNESSSYKVKVWLDYNADNNYMDKTFTAKVLVNSFQESSYAKDVIKGKLVKYEESSNENFTGGLVAVNTDGELYNEIDDSQEIREYRYSGPSVNNYVTFNDEVWRIIGVFKDEVGKEHVKIVRGNVLTADMFPEEYVIKGTTYNIKYPSSNYAYWNRKVSGTNNNDWATAGLQYWLNTTKDGQGNNGYLSTLKVNSLNMMEDTKYYLGTIGNISVTCKSSSDFNWTTTSYGTALEVYQNEMAINEVYNEEETSKNCGFYETFPTTYEGTKGGKLWPGNNGIWTGKVSLLYPSDYGYSAIIENWIIDLHDYDTIILSSWLNSANHIYNECLLSPTSSASNRIALWNNAGAIGAYYAYEAYEIRPTLYLKSNVKITSGVGTSDSPYKLSLA